MNKFLKTLLSKKMRKPLILFVCGVVALFIIRKMYNTVEGFELQPANLESKLEGSKKLVLFYADWCGHCKNFKPVWDDVASGVNTDGEEKLVKVNVGDSSSENEEIMKKYNVDGFPTVVLVDNSSGNTNLNVYEGERTKEGLEEFVQSNL
jgi:protein disulfide-isomerase-like protein